MVFHFSARTIDIRARYIHVYFQMNRYKYSVKVFRLSVSSVAPKRLPQSFNLNPLQTRSKVPKRKKERKKVRKKELNKEKKAICTLTVRPIGTPGDGLSNGSGVVPPGTGGEATRE
jgi:hypothetical protein